MVLTNCHLTGCPSVWTIAILAFPTAITNMATYLANIASMPLPIYVSAQVYINILDNNSLFTQTHNKVRCTAYRSPAEFICPCPALLHLHTLMPQVNVLKNVPNHIHLSGSKCHSTKIKLMTRNCVLCHTAHITQHTHNHGNQYCRYFIAMVVTCIPNTTYTL